jgi:hypothetical protein
MLCTTNCKNGKLTKQSKLALCEFTQHPSYFGFCDRFEAVTFLRANTGVGECKYVLYETKRPPATNTFQAVTFVYDIILPGSYRSETYFLHWDSDKKGIIVCETLYASNFSTIYRRIQLPRLFFSYLNAIWFVIGQHDYHINQTSISIDRPFHWNLSDLCSFVIQRSGRKRDKHIFNLLVSVEGYKNKPILCDYTYYQNNRLPILLPVQSATVIVSDIDYFVNQSNYFGFCSIEGVLDYLAKHCEEHCCYYLLFENDDFFLNKKRITLQIVLFFHKVHLTYTKGYTERVLVYYLYWCSETNKVILCQKDIRSVSKHFVKKRSFGNYKTAVQYVLGHYSTNNTHELDFRYSRRNPDQLASKPFVRPFHWNLVDLSVFQLKRTHPCVVIEESCAKKRKAASLADSYESLHPQYLSKRRYLNDAATTEQTEET